jgi:hypothetical protein
VEENAYVVELLAELLYLPAAALLLRLAAQTGKLPERLLGLTFTCMSGSYLLYEAPYFLGLEAYELQFVVAGRIVYGAGCITIAFFTRAVFRPRERWAGVAVGVCVALMLFGFALGCATGDLEGASLGNPGFWIEWGAQMFPTLWLAAEGFSHYRSAHRRLRIGLSDPHVCNRFLLWGLFGLAQLGSGVAVLWMYAVYTVDGHISIAADVMLGGVEIISIALVWLAFAAPAFYRRWIEHLTSAESPAEQ